MTTEVAGRAVKPRICVVTYPRPMASVVPLSNLMSIVSKLSSFAYLITGNEGARVLQNDSSLKGCSLIYKPDRNTGRRIIGHAVLQVRTALEILRINRNIDIYMFFFGEGLTLPLVVSGMTRKPVILNLAGSLPRISEDKRDLLSRLFVSMELLNYRLAHRIIIYSCLLIADWKLQRYTKKISIAHEHFIDIGEFSVQKPINKRRNLVGFTGRLSPEKGVLNFVKAIPDILQFDKDIQFVIAGEGELKSEIEEFLVGHALSDSCRLVGWVSHEDLPLYFNDLKLLVLPSFTEGLPNVILEAMACGTPVLATPVGAIPDYIRDGETGFLMSNNSEESISKNVIRALNHSKIEQVAANGRILIENEFTFERAVSNFGVIFEGISKKMGFHEACRPKTSQIGS
jgi:glycosyltransferase involved in cell wall biosynthesis